MNFGQAIEALKASEKVARTGWNGKGMWLQLFIPHESDGFVIAIDGEGKWMPLSAHILLKTADDKFVPWQPSQTDMLAEDWEIV